MTDFGYETHPSIARLDSIGYLMWKNNFFIDDTSFSDIISCAVDKGTDHYALVCNSIYVYNYREYVKINIIDIDDDGTIKSMKRIDDSCFGEDGNYEYRLYSNHAINTIDGGLAITGFRLTEYNPYTQIFTVKLDEDGMIDVSGLELSNIILNNCYPNPLNENTIISFFVKEESDISLKIYDLQGKEVKTLLNRFMQSGSYSYIWDGTSNNGESLSSGMYIYRLKSDSEHTAKKLILIR
jgi:hypothetical protein